MADGSSIARRRPAAARTQRTQLHIGLVNNMPDAAFLATERQFTGLIAEGRGETDVRVSLFSLASTPRGELTTAAMGDRYGDLDALMRSGIDALVVTGAEPKTDDLRAEPYWDEMTRLIDWANNHTISTLWSCLAAHAAVLRLDGITRQPLPAKCAGVFACERVGADPLVADIPAVIRIPHSRRNGLRVNDLVAAGYQLLTRSRDVGADLFVRRGRSLFVFLQGHPEYDADGLLKEYCRDVGRYLRGQQDVYPSIPVGYLDTAAMDAFHCLGVRARLDRDPALIARCQEIAAAITPAQPWRRHAVTLYRNWIDLMAQQKAQQNPVPGRLAR